MEITKGGAVCFVAHANDEVDRTCVRENVQSDKLAQLSLEAISLDDCSAMPRNYDANPRM